jgi:hypothetical protein
MYFISIFPDDRIFSSGYSKPLEGNSTVSVGNVKLLIYFLKTITVININIKKELGKAKLKFKEYLNLLLEVQDTVIWLNCHSKVDSSVFCIPVVLTKV